MAVQKSKVSGSRRGKRRSHHGLADITLSLDPNTGESHRRHHMTATGSYRGNTVIKQRLKATD